MFFGTIGLMTPLDPIETRILFGMGGGETTHRQATATGARALAWPGSHQGIAPDETEAANEDEAARILRIWTGFLERTQQSTRYNGVRRLAARARVRTPTVTTVAVFADDDLFADEVAFVNAADGFELIKAFAVVMYDHEADFVHVGIDQHTQRLLACTLFADKHTSERIDFDFVGVGFYLF